MANMRGKPDDLVNFMFGRTLGVGMTAVDRPCELPSHCGIERHDSVVWAAKLSGRRHIWWRVQSNSASICTLRVDIRG